MRKALLLFGVTALLPVPRTAQPQPVTVPSGVMLAEFEFALGAVRIPGPGETPRPWAGGGQSEAGARPMIGLLFGIEPLAGLAQPYLGLGLGQIESGGSSGLAEPERRLGYGGVLGMAMPLGVLPGASVMAEYRFLGVAQANGLRTGPVRSLPHDGSEPDTLSHSVLIGLRYAFGSPSEPGGGR